MPLLDHFSPPLSRVRHWQAFHSAWANEIVRQLNHALLPEEFVAEPTVKIGSQVEIDVATLEQPSALGTENGGLAVATYAPPKPTLVFNADWSDQDVFEIQVQKEEGGLRLVAAIELVSPANKDRPSHREAFLRKCASYLQQGIALVIVDMIAAQRTGNLAAELTIALGHEAASKSEPNSMIAAAYRTILAGTETRVEVWQDQLRFGSELPTLPLWLDFDLPIPLDLEESYRATCETLRIRL